MKFTRNKEHVSVAAQLDAQDKRIVDMAARLERLEAEIGVWRPIMANFEEQREGA